MKEKKRRREKMAKKAKDEKRVRIGLLGDPLSYLMGRKGAKIDVESESEPGPFISVEEEEKNLEKEAKEARENGKES